MKAFKARGLVAGVALLACGASVAGINSWTVSGPQGGNFFDLERSTTAPNTVYATYGHSFFRSTNGGRTWNAGFNFELQAGDIAVDPTDGRRVYVAVVGNVGAGVYRTEDGGDTFTRVASPFFGAWGVGVGGADGRTVYYSASNVFARSTDRGATWTVRSTPMNVVQKMLVDRNNPDQIVGKIGSWLGRSNDGGTTWIETTPNGFWPIDALHRVSPSVLLIGTGIAILRSGDNGETWTQVAFGSAWSIGSDAANPNLLAAGGYEWSALQRSSDGGATWTYAGFPPRMRLIRGVLLANGGNSVIAADEEGVQLSNDGGNTWAASTRGPVASGAAVLFAADHFGSPVYANTGSLSLYSSRDGGPWNLAPGFRLGQTTLIAKPDDGQTLYASPFQQGVLKSVDGGNSWTNIGGLQGVDFVLAASRQDTNRLFATIQWPFYSLPNTAARFFTSADAGNTWAEIATNLPTAIKVTSFVVDPKNHARMFVAGGNTGFGSPESGGLHRSIDGGVTFAERGFGHVDVTDVAIDGDQPRFVYVASQLGLHVSTNGGDTFTPNAGYAAFSPLAAGAVAVDPEVTSNVYASSGNASPYSEGVRTSWILRSVDRGQTWEVLRANTAMPNYYVNRLLVDPSTPTRIYANTGVHGIASFELRTDLAVTLANHSGARLVGVPTSYQVNISNGGPYHATRVQVSARIPAGATQVSWTAPSGGFCGRHGTKVDCEVAVLRNGATNAITVRYTPTQPGAISVRADIDAHEDDLNNANNGATATATGIP